MHPVSAQPTLGMLIRKLESIATLSNAERQAIQSLPVRIQNLSARQDIVRDGDQPTHCCLILDGWACRYKMLSEGKRQILSFHVSGVRLNLTSMQVPTMHHSTAKLTKAVIAFIPHGTLRELTASHSGLAAAFWRDTLIDAAVFRE
ncbi:Crp/Fnr family transcriptional regulator [Methylobacterium sp. E-065]|uniref:Crp/Fnr family transcriptional regulator n=1 Tax=Methylobacterium sp. E-065 TaxID=2836583 RepID=UPI001FB949C9|nr:Crp/Fnr family transcriptional regulator [Methylobacterium sp. E-065]MCJ2017577.1 Crp/Fnr family transcriptional regulator [Methylobacterium sp. E-065]